MCLQTKWDPVFLWPQSAIQKPVGTLEFLIAILACWASFGSHSASNFLIAIGLASEETFKVLSWIAIRNWPFWITTFRDLCGWPVTEKKKEVCTVHFKKKSTWNDHDTNLGVHQDYLYSFQVLNRVLYLWQAEAPKMGLVFVCEWGNNISELIGCTLKYNWNYVLSKRNIDKNNF